MSTGGAERDERFGYLEDQFRIVINRFGGSNEVADKLLPRFRYLEEEEGGVMKALIYRDADHENFVGASWIDLQFNPHRRTLTTTVYLGGLVKRELSKDILDSISRVFAPDEETVVFENDRRMLWLNRDSLVITTPS